MTFPVMRRAARVLILALTPAVAAGACHDSTGPKVAPGPTSGHWTGSPSGYGPMDFTITQTDTLISGSGTIHGPDGTVEPMDVIGFVPTATDSTPVIMTFSAENVVPSVFIGALSQDGAHLIGNLTITFVSQVDTITFLRQ